MLWIKSFKGHPIGLDYSISTPCSSQYFYCKPIIANSLFVSRKMLLAEVCTPSDYYLVEPDVWFCCINSFTHWTAVFSPNTFSLPDVLHVLQEGCVLTVLQISRRIRISLALHLGPFFGSLSCFRMARRNVCPVHFLSPLSRPTELLRSDLSVAFRYRSWGFEGCPCLGSV